MHTYNTRILYIHTLCIDIHIYTYIHIYIIYARGVHALKLFFVELETSERQRQGANLEKQATVLNLRERPRCLRSSRAEIHVRGLARAWRKAIKSSEFMRDV